MNTVRAIFSIRSKVIQPSAITRHLSCEPDSVTLAGQARSPTRPNPKANGWHLECVEARDGDVIHTLSMLMSRVSPIRDKIQNLYLEDPEIEVLFSLCVTPYTDNISLYIPADIVTFAASIGCSIDVDFFESE